MPYVKGQMKDYKGKGKGSATSKEKIADARAAWKERFVKRQASKKAKGK